MILPGTGRGTAEGGGGGSAPRQRPEVYAARRLRKSLSLPEVLLWEELRGNKLGFKARRQHPIGPYVVDFSIAAARLVVEIDGESHARGTRPVRDRLRDNELRRQGYRILRIAAGDVLKDLEAVLRMIVAEVHDPLHHPTDGLPPQNGEEL